MVKDTLYWEICTYLLEFPDLISWDKSEWWAFTVWMFWQPFYMDKKKVIFLNIFGGVSIIMMLKSKSRNRTWDLISEYLGASALIQYIYYYIRILICDLNYTERSYYFLWHINHAPALNSRYLKKSDKIV